MGINRNGRDGGLWQKNACNKRLMRHPTDILVSSSMSREQCSFGALVIYPPGDKGTTDMHEIAKERR